MKTSLRSLLSAVTGLGLVAFTLISAFTAGADAAATFLAFSLLTVFGLVEIAILSYTPRRYALRPIAPQPLRATVARPVRVRVPALIEVPASAYTRRAA